MNDIINYPMAQVSVRVDEGTVWLTQAQMSVLFGRGIASINKHLKKIFSNGELEEKSTISFFEMVADDGKTYQAQHYNLDAIISVGYRVNSKQGVAFRRWATGVLRERMLAELGIRALCAGRSGKSRPASLTYGAAPDPCMVRGILEANIKRVCGLSDLVGVAAFVEKSLAGDWLRSCGATFATVREMVSERRLDCVAHYCEHFPKAGPLRMKGIMYAGAKLVHNCMFTDIAVYVIARDCKTGKEGFLKYQPGRGVEDYHLPPLWQMVFSEIQNAKANNKIKEN